MLDLCDAIFYTKDGQPSSAHLYTYPAIVLRVDASAQRLTLHYLCDGLTADADQEAFQIAEGVPASAAVRASTDVERWLTNDQCPWTRCSFRRVRQIREGGAEAFLQSLT